MLVCPELYATGYNIGRVVRDLAEPVDGPLVAAAAGIAAKTGIAIIFGYPERADGRVFNSAAVLDGKGRVVDNFRKLHLAGPYEKENFTAGDRFVTVTVKGVRVAVLICYDFEMPEAVRACALAGAQLVAVPTALRTRYSHVATAMAPTRAFENGLFIAYANHAGSEGDWRYCGLSCIAGPDGDFLAQAGAGEELITAELDIARLRRARQAIPYLGDRRPELYHRSLA